MKKKLAACLAAVLLAFGSAGYFGKQYFDNHYILLNEEDVMNLQISVQMAQMAAFQAGRTSCINEERKSPPNT